MIEARNLVKAFGGTPVVNDVSFTVEPGTVTGLLGPNGAGKSTIMKLILGLEHPQSGTVTVQGSPYTAARAPMREVGALLTADWVHPRRSARQHLQALAVTHGYGRARVDKVLHLTGIEDAASTAVGKFSLGMRQRLGIAGALLGDPGVLVLDEPVNGLDPDGVIWVRTFLRELAAEGRTVLLSSHLMSEMERTADRIIIIGGGQVLADETLSGIMSAETTVLVRTPQRVELLEALTAHHVSVHDEGDGALRLTGLPAAEVGALAAHTRIELHELRTLVGSLEDSYRKLVADSVEYRAGETTRNHT